MADLISPMTELEAVNEILAAIGESPIASFDESFADATIARQTLTTVSRQIQLNGWTFNTELSVTLSPDVDGFIHLPTNTLKVTPSYTETKYIHRGTRLYDRDARTYVFTEDVDVAELVLALPFEELPEAARAFITVRAGRRFFDRVGATQDQHGFHVQDERAAWVALQNYEASIAQYNVLDNMTLMQTIRGRR